MRAESIPKSCLRAAAYAMCADTNHARFGVVSSVLSRFKEEIHTVPWPRLLPGTLRQQPLATKPRFEGSEGTIEPVKITFSRRLRQLPGEPF